GLEGGGQVPLLQEGAAEARVGVREMGIQLNGLGEGGDGLAGTAQLVQGIAQGEVSAGTLWTDSQRGPVKAERLVVPGWLHLAERNGQLHVDPEVARVALLRLPEAVQGGRPSMMGDQEGAEQDSGGGWLSKYLGPCCQLLHPFPSLPDLPAAELSAPGIVVREPGDC